MRKILVADTQVKRLNSITAALTLIKKDFSVYKFESFEEAVRHAENSTPDVVFLGLPKGLDDKYLNQLKSVSAVIGILGKGDEGIIKKAVKSGIEDFVYPPYMPLNLESKSRVVCRERIILMNWKRKRNILRQLLR